MTIYIQITHNQILRKNYMQNITSSAELEMLSVSHTFHHRPLPSVLNSMKFNNAVLTSKNQEVKWPCTVGSVACRALGNTKHTHSSTWKMESGALCMITWALAMYRTCSKFGTLHCPLSLSQCHLCLTVSGMGWVGRDLSKAVWFKSPSGAGTPFFHPLFQRAYKAAAGSDMSNSWTRNWPLLTGSNMLQFSLEKMPINHWPAKFHLLQNICKI